MGQTSKALKSTSEIPVKELDEIKDTKLKARLRDLCATVRDANSEIDAHQVIKRKALDELLVLAKSNKLQKVGGPDWMLLRTTSSHSSIKKEKLLKAGVSMDIIDASTETKITESVRVTAREDKAQQ